MPFERLGPLFIAAAALLWATDAPFRAPLVKRLDPVFIVLVNHLIGFGAVASWFWAQSRAGAGFRLRLTGLRAREHLSAAVVGIGGSALATVFFTASFAYVNPSVTILLQKLQPLMVILLARAFLKEAPPRGFHAWALVALCAGLVLSFPNLDFGFLRAGPNGPEGPGGNDLRSRGVLYAISAAALWALSTLAGKSLTRRHSPSRVTLLRYAYGVAALSALWLASGKGAHRASIAEAGAWGSFLYMSLVSGLLAMLLYYQGMARTKASVITVVELVYPVGAIAVNAIWLDSPLSPVQAAAAATLLLAVAQVSRR